jgi:hypothetical protein
VKTVPKAAGKVPPPAPPQPKTNGSVSPIAGEKAPAAEKPPENIDAEALAASLLSDEPKQEVPVEEQKTFTFNCPQCDEPMTAPTDMQGKQTPCPSCRRIVKVPVLKKPEVIDWRGPNKNIPSGAKANVLPEYQTGATTTGTVSAAALEEAGALPQQREKLTRAQLIKRVAVVAAIVLVVGGGTWSLLAFLSQNKQNRAIDQAVEIADAASKPGGKPELRKEAIAALHRAAGEWYLHSGRRNGLDKSLDQFKKARTLATRTPGGDPVLIELAFSQIALGGSEAEIAAGTRLKWDGDPRKGIPVQTTTASAELVTTLQAIGSSEGKMFAAREVCRQLVDRKQRKLAVVVLLAVLGGLEDFRVEAPAIAGLEVLRADPAQAEDLAQRAIKLAAAPGPGGKPPEVAPSLVALCVALKKPELLQGLPEARNLANAQNPAVRQGYIVGLALQGDSSALDQAKAIPPPLLRLQALLEAATGLPEKDAKPFAEAAADVVEGELKNQGAPSWTLTRLAFQLARCGLSDRAAKIAALVNNPGLRGWAQLHALRASLAGSRTTADDARTEEIEKQSIAYFLAKEAAARHNAKHDGSGTASNVTKWEEPLRAFGRAGYALGLQELD